MNNSGYYRELVGCAADKDSIQSRQIDRQAEEINRLERQVAALDVMLERQIDIIQDRDDELVRQNAQLKALSNKRQKALTPAQRRAKDGEQK